MECSALKGHPPNAFCRGTLMTFFSKCGASFKSMYTSLNWYAQYGLKAAMNSFKSIKPSLFKSNEPKAFSHIFCVAAIETPFVRKTCRQWKDTMVRRRARTKAMKRKEKVNSFITKKGFIDIGNKESYKQACEQYNKKIGKI